MNKELGIYFGAISNPIAQQLKEQGFKFDKHLIKQFQELADSHNRLRINLLLPENVSDVINRKLYKRIEKHVMAVNKLKRATI